MDGPLLTLDQSLDSHKLFKQLMCKKGKISALDVVKIDTTDIE